MKKVPSYQTSDNQLFTNRLGALNHEFRLELRGAIQQHTKNTTLTTTDIAAILATDSEKIAGILHKYRVQINRARGEANKVKVI